MIQLKSVTRIPSSGRRPIVLPSPASNHAGGAKSREFLARVAEPPAQDLLVMLAEQWRAARNRRRRAHPHQRTRIAKAPGDRMIDFDEGGARAQMGMLGGLRNGQHGA